MLTLSAGAFVARLFSTGEIDGLPVSILCSPADPPFVAASPQPHPNNDVYALCTNPAGASCSPLPGGPTAAILSHLDTKYEIKLAESASETLAVEPGKELTSTAPAIVPVAPRSSATSVVGAGAIGLGIAGLAIGAVTGILAIVEEGDASSACPDAARCTSPAGLDAAASGKALAGVSTASFAVGLAGAAAGVIVLVAGNRAPAAPAAAFAPWVLPSSAGLGVTGRF